MIIAEYLNLMELEFLKGSALNMVGRNDLCPCGSGKKYKKCCENNKQDTMKEILMFEEIEQILQTFYNVYPERSDIKEYIEAVNKWLPHLKNHLQRELIEAVALDDFFFHQRHDIWANYLKRVKKKAIRPGIIELLNLWDEPRLFIGQVDKVENQYLFATCTLTKQQIRIRRESNRPVPEGMQVFAFILPESATEEHCYLAVSTLIFYPENYKQVFENFAKGFNPSKQSVAVFLKENHLNFWQQLVEFGYTGEEYTSFEIEVVDLTKQFLQERNLESNGLVETLEDYLVEKKPKARKAAAIAAGAIRFAQERNILETTYTVKEIAESFNVSASSLNKYYQELLQYVAVPV